MLLSLTGYEFYRTDGSLYRKWHEPKACEALGILNTRRWIFVQRLKHILKLCLYAVSVQKCYNMCIIWISLPSVCACR